VADHKVALWDAQKCRGGVKQGRRLRHWAVGKHHREGKDHEHSGQPVGWHMMNGLVYGLGVVDTVQNVADSFSVDRVVHPLDEVIWQSATKYYQNFADIAISSTTKDLP
jgi:hypothetical protein